VVEVSTARDIIIIILGCFYIIITLGIIIGSIILFLKMKHFIDSINNKLRQIYKWMCYFHRVAKVLNFSMNMIK
jgi:hypothetical protein